MSTRKVETLSDVGRFLGRLRKATGLTRKAVARRMGICASDVGRIERGERDIRVSTLLSFLAAVGIHIELKEGR